MELEFNLFDPTQLNNNLGYFKCNVCAKDETKTVVTLSHINGRTIAFCLEHFQDLMDHLYGIANRIIEKYLDELGGAELEKFKDKKKIFDQVYLEVKERERTEEDYLQLFSDLSKKIDQKTLIRALGRTNRFATLNATYKNANGTYTEIGEGNLGAVIDMKKQLQKPRKGLGRFFGKFLKVVKK